MSQTIIRSTIEYFYFLQIKVVMKIMTMNDEKTKQKAIEAVADIYGNYIN